MDGLQQLISAYLRQSWPPFAAGAVLGLIVGIWL